MMVGSAHARFPSLAWAWPKGGRDQLVRAATLLDLDRAGQMFSAWSAQHDFNDVTFAEQRLLVAISARLPASVLAGPSRARLKGIERMLWTHSAVSLQAAKPALQLLSDAGVPMMVLKGAARAAIDMQELRGRFASDVDLLVPRQHFSSSYRALRAAGWQHGQRREPDLARIIGINLRRGTNGDLDLHKYPFHQLVDDDADQTRLWADASDGVLLGHQVSVPSPTDRLVMAIAHGGIDGHQHSDWLVDCAAVIRDGAVDWPLFEQMCAGRQLEAHAAIALTYLADAIEVDIPPDVLRRVTASGRASWVRHWSALLQARPKTEHNAVSALGRGIARGDRQVRRAYALWRLEARRISA